MQFKLTTSTLRLKRTSLPVAQELKNFHTMASPRRIELIILGNELLLGARTNEHLSYLASELGSYGLSIARNFVIQDDASEIGKVFKDAWKRSNILITTGGLGPTSNDNTREAIAKALGRKLKFDEDTRISIEERLSQTGMTLTEKVMKQCYYPEGFTLLPNRIGTAPGLLYREGNKTLIMLPGPTAELKSIFEKQAIPHLKKSNFLVHEKNSILVRTAGVAESIIEEHLTPIFEKHPNIKVGFCSKHNLVDIRLSPKRPGLSSKTLKKTAETCKQALGNHFVCFGATPLAEVVIQMLAERKKTIAVAESCTGGLLANAFTDVPGASQVFAGGDICYNNDAKIELLDVPESLLLQHGSVSAEVALAMVTGVAERFCSDYALSSTGFAGPGGGTKENPVGTVYLGFYSPLGAWSRKIHFMGDRPTVKQHAVNAALDWVRRELLEEPSLSGQPSIEEWALAEILK